MKVETWKWTIIRWPSINMKNWCLLREQNQDPDEDFDMDCWVQQRCQDVRIQPTL